MPQGDGTTLEIYEIDKLCRIGAGIIESGVSADGKSRYQITSDGMLECWGYLASVGNEATITFPAEFNAAPPSVITQAGPEGTSAIFDFAQPYSVTATQFRLTYRTSTGEALTNRAMNWRAKGLAKV